MYILNIYITIYNCNFLVTRESPRRLGLQRLGLGLCAWDVGCLVTDLSFYWEWLIYRA